MAGGLSDIRFLIRDRDSKYTRSFDEIFRTEGVRAILTPVRSPKANACAERFVRTVRAELLDLVLVIGRRQLLSVLKEYEHHYNSHRPHRGIDLHAPERVGSDAAVVPLRQIRRTKVVAALINEYCERAA